MQPRRPSVLLVSEDGSDAALPVMRALTHKLFGRLAPSYRSDQLQIEPLKSAEARLASIGQRWKSQNPKDEPLKRELLRELASKLAEGPDSFVIFHVDGDCRFSDSRQGTRFASLDALQRFVGRIPQLAAARPTPGRNDADSLACAMRERLFFMLPFYSIEAWLYQNSEEAIRLCQERHGGRDVEVFRDWASNRGALDEVPKIKERTCLRDRANRELAEMAFPIVAALSAEKSLSLFLARLAESAALRAALAQKGDLYGQNEETEAVG